MYIVKDHLERCRGRCLFLTEKSAETIIDLAVVWLLVPPLCSQAGWDGSCGFDPFRHAAGHPWPLSPCEASSNSSEYIMKVRCCNSISLTSHCHTDTDISQGYGVQRGFSNKLLNLSEILWSSLDVLNKSQNHQSPQKMIAHTHLLDNK